MDGDGWDKQRTKAVTDVVGVTLKLPSSQTKDFIEGLFDEEMGVRSNPSALRVLGLGGGKGRSIADVIFGD